MKKNFNSPPQSWTFSSTGPGYVDYYYETLLWMYMKENDKKVGYEKGLKKRKKENDINNNVMY